MWIFLDLFSCPEQLHCKKFIIIAKGNITLKVGEDLQVLLNDKVVRLQQPNRHFRTEQIGNTVIVEDIKTSIRVQISDEGIIEIHGPSDMTNRVQGLCGNFNGNSMDDKVNRNYEVLRSTKQFVDSWKATEFSCHSQSKPANNMKIVADICNIVKMDTFKSCHNLVPYKDFLSKCVELASECLKHSGNDERKCRCTVLESYTRSCYLKDEYAELGNWRSEHLCGKFSVNLT